MVIKLEAWVIKRVKNLNLETNKIRDLLIRIEFDKQNLWELMKKKYPDYNFDGAEMNVYEDKEGGELILPFQDEEEENKK